MSQRRTPWASDRPWAWAVSESSTRLPKTSQLWSPWAGVHYIAGGGITPDLVVLPDTLSTGEQEAVQRLFRAAGAFASAVFNHAVSYVQDHPDLEPGFTLPPAELDLFYRTLVDEHEVELEESDFLTALRFVTYQLEHQIALQAWDEERAFLHNRGNDKQLNDAIEILKQADTPEALFGLAGAERPLQTATSAGASVSSASGPN